MVQKFVNTVHKQFNKHVKKQIRPLKKYVLLESINFLKVNETAKTFAEHIELHFNEISKILLEYESFEVVQDETLRTLDLLRNLDENKEFFRLRIGAVTSFLPRNQPLYALTCFALIPSLLATEVHFRIPHSMKKFFSRLLKILEINHYFPNILISKKERLVFLEQRSGLRVNPKTQESWPVTDAVIFTGTSSHAERLRLIFDSRTLFIANGAGHNPLVISNDADIDKAAEAALTLQLYNQGQDCAAPNAILIQRSIFHIFLQVLREKLRKVQVGPYRNKSCRVGPISKPEDLVRIQNILIEHRRWLDPTTPGIIRALDAIVEPTIICKPLKEGGNFTEVFAPIIFLQEYEEDKDLSLYFESPHYSRNAMYISLFGTSEYIMNLIGRPINEKILHDSKSVLHNTHLHMPGIERGTQPYGGYGYGASSLSINGKIICKPTLPQRDIFEHIAKPLLSKKKCQEHKAILRRAVKIIPKDVQKLLGIKHIEDKIKYQVPPEGIVYFDSHAIRGEGHRYVRIEKNHTFSLLFQPNIEHMVSLEPKDIQMIRTLREFLQRHPILAVDEFASWLYAIPKKSGASEKENRYRQSKFFTHIYQLLLGKESGPRIANFLLDADRKKICELLNI